MEKVNGHRPNLNDHNKVTRLEYQDPKAKTSLSPNINNHEDDNKKNAPHPKLGQKIDLKF